MDEKGETGRKGGREGGRSKKTAGKRPGHLAAKMRTRKPVFTRACPPSLSLSTTSLVHSPGATGKDDGVRQPHRPAGPTMALPCAASVYAGCRTHFFFLLSLCFFSIKTTKKKTFYAGSPSLHLQPHYYHKRNEKKPTKKNKRKTLGALGNCSAIAPAILWGSLNEKQQTKTAKFPQTKWSLPQTKKKKKPQKPNKKLINSARVFGRGKDDKSGDLLAK